MAPPRLKSKPATAKKTSPQRSKAAAKGRGAKATTAVGKKLKGKKVKAQPAAPRPRTPPPAATSSPSERRRAFVDEAERDGHPLIEVTTVARPLARGPVDAATLGAGAFLTVGPLSEVAVMVATALAPWASRAAAAGLSLLLDRDLPGAESAFSALAGWLQVEVRVCIVEELELEGAPLIRLAFVDRAAHKAFLTAVHVPAALVQTSFRIDPLALDDPRSQRPVQVERSRGQLRIRPSGRRGV